MTLSITVDGVTLPHRVRLNDGTNNGIDGLTSAADGSGSMGGVIIDDPNHDLVLQGWQTCIVEESDCTAAPRLFTGFIGDRTTTHGNYPLDIGRQVNVTIYDQNVLLSWALITGDDGKRPVESRPDRGQWLIDSDYLDTIVFDTGFYNVTGSSDLQEADYRDQYPRDVLDDMMDAGQVAFAFWDEAAGKIGIFYDFITATTYDSTLSISNDPADVTITDGVISGTCWPPYIDAELVQDPSEVYSLEVLTYTGGRLVKEDPTTKATFFPSPYPDRGQATDRSRIGKLGTAQNAINSLLLQASEENATVTCTLLLPSTHVGLVDAGQRISVKFTHLDGYEDFTYTRIASRTTRQALGRQDWYEVQLTLNLQGPFGGGGGGGGANPPPTVFPPGPPSSAHFFSEDVPMFGDLGWLANSAYGSPTLQQTGSLGTITLVAGALYNWDVLLPLFDPRANPTVTVTLVNDSLTSVLSEPIFLSTSTGQFGGAGLGPYHYSGSFTAPSGGSLKNPYRIQVGAQQLPHGHDLMATVSFWVDPDGFTPTPPTPLFPGQPNARPEIVTMSGTDGTTLWPFADGTLKVFVDLLDQTGAVTSQNGSLGTFTLGFTPKAGEQVTVEYVGR